MEKSTFVYVTYIRTTPEKLWAKLTETGVARERPRRYLITFRTLERSPPLNDLASARGSEPSRSTKARK